MARFQDIVATLYPIIFLARNLAKIPEPAKIVMYFSRKKIYTTGPFISVGAHATFSAVFCNVVITLFLLYINNTDSL